MDDSPLVYIILLTWNGKADTLECLRSLQHITYSNARVLVVDNASTDGTVATVQREFPHVELMVNGSNLRFAGGNNVGIRRALQQDAAYVLLLNNDTVVDRVFLGHLVRAAEREPRIGMVGPKIYYAHEPQRIWFAGGKVEWWKGWISHVGVRELDHGQYDQPSETAYLTGCCLFVKRAVIDAIGLLDEAYYLYGEDADWCLRASRAGFTLLYVPSARIWHKLSVSSGGHLSWMKNWNKLKSQVRLMLRYAHWYHWLTIPGWMVIKILHSYLRVRRVA